MHVLNDKVVTLILGSPGSGKSTLLAKIVSDGNKKGIPVYTNYPTLGARIIDMKTLVDYNLGKSVLVIDEAGLEYNSRNSRAFTVELYHYFMTTRHRDTQLFFIVQSWKRIDIVLRELATEIILCKKFFFGFTMYRTFNSETTLISNSEGYALEFQEVFKQGSLHFFWRPKYYHMFDTKYLDREYLPGPLEEYPEDMFPVKESFIRRLLGLKARPPAPAQAVGTAQD